MFSNKMLYIPDYVVSEDIPTIINYFDYYNIAKVKNVEVFNHLESEYLTEYNDFYCFALIEISNCNSDTNICSVINSQPHTNNKQEEVCYSSQEDNDCLDENYVYE